MKLEQTRRLLDRIGMLRHPCDLDLLVFFVRHPRTLMASEQLAAFLGCELARLNESLNVLLGAGLLTRTQNPAHAARMFVLETSGTDGGWLPDLIELASTREGRLIMQREMKRRVPDRAPGSGATADDRAPSTAARGPRPILVRQQPPPIGDQDAEPRARRKGGR